MVGVVYRARERAIPHFLSVMITLAERYGSEIVIADLPNYVDLGDGYRIARSSIKRYVDHIVRYCEENGIDPCPVAKELVPDSRRGRVLLVRIDIDRARQLIYELGGEIALRKQISMEYAKKVDYLEKELRECRKSLEKCREQLDECRKLYKLARCELNEVRKICGAELVEELKQRVRDLEKENEVLRKRVEELGRELDKYRSAIDRLIDELAKFLDRKVLRRCIREWSEDGGDPVCTYVLKILDIATAGRTRALIDDFVDRWEEDSELRRLEQYDSERIREMLARLVRNAD